MGTRQGPKQGSSHFPRRKYMTVRPHAGHGCACYLQSQFSATERPTMRTFTLQTSDGLALQVHHSSARQPVRAALDRKSTRLNSSHVKISYAVFCLKKQ